MRGETRGKDIIMQIIYFLLEIKLKRKENLYLY